MPRLILRRPARTSPSFPTGALIAGLGLGAVAGFLLAELAGPEATHVLQRVVRRGPRKTRVAGLVDDAQAALDGDLPLRDHGVHVIAVGPGRIELHGWVDSRAARSRAERLVRNAVPADAVINCVLVHGEDDPAGPPDAADELLA